MLPTYVAVPLFTMLLCGLAAWAPIVKVGQASMVLGLCAAGAWVAGMFGILARSTIEAASLLAALAMAILGRALGEELALARGWPVPETQAALIIAAMWILAGVTQALALRAARRGRT